MGRFQRAVHIAVTVGALAGGAGADEPARTPDVTVLPPVALAPCPPASGGDFWTSVPPVRPMPRLGNFAIPPRGPGYYSLADVLHGEYRDKPPRYPFPPFGLMPQPFFD